MEVMKVMEVMKAKPTSSRYLLTAIIETRTAFGREVVLDCGVVGGNEVPGSELSDLHHFHHLHHLHHFRLEPL
jgi:hypothetical protein